MPVMKRSDKGKSKSVGSSIDKIPNEGKKFNLRFEKVTKTDTGGNTSKKLKCVTSNFKCLFYKRKARESDGRSESSKSSSPTGDSVESSSPTPDGILSPEIEVRQEKVPVPSERRSKTSVPNGTLDRPVPAPRTVRPAIIATSNRIPSQQVIYDEQSSLRNFHLQSLGHIGPQGQLLFRAPTQNFRHPPPISSTLPGPPLPPRNNSNFPSVVYAPGRGHGPMVAYVRGPFPPSRHPHSATMGRPPPPHFVRVRAPHSQQPFILRYPPPPRLMFRSPYELPNHCSMPNLYASHKNPNLHENNYGAGQNKCIYGSTRDELSVIHLPTVPQRHQSLAVQPENPCHTKQALVIQHQHHVMKNGLFQTLRVPSKKPPSESSGVSSGREDQIPPNPRPNMGTSTAHADRHKNTVKFDGSTYVKNETIDSIHSCGGGSDPALHQTSSLWPTVLIDHKLPRVPNPVHDNHQRQIVTANMRQLGNRKASMINITNTDSNMSRIAKSHPHGSVSCSDLRRIDDKAVENSCVPWFRWFARYNFCSFDKICTCTQLHIDNR